MIALVVSAWCAVVVYVAFRYQALFREVVFRYPVVAFESDDWGPGPPEDAIRLRELMACAVSYRDATGRPTAVTIGVVLSVAQTPLTASQAAEYRRVTLGSDRFSPVRAALVEGEEQGVFFLQLHCAEHYWPQALLAVARRENSVAQWLATPGVPRTESLPSYLQSRWIDTSTLPSQALEPNTIALAVDDEVRLFDQVFGEIPKVVVPPTFVWDRWVEAAWAHRGIKVIITSGCRREGRDSQGNLEPPTRRTYNGERSIDKGPLYLVRDVYFEPALGHRAQETIARIVEKAQLGRPALVEMHRFNFVDDPQKANANLSEFRRLIDLTLAALPNLRFVSPLALAEAIAHRDASLVETRFLSCVAVWLRRLWRERRVRWLAVATGAIVPGAALWIIANVATRKLRGGAMG